jgi:Dolichyl-phosphate-mannose-protein mannosyltransferase
MNSRATKSWALPAVAVLAWLVALWLGYNCVFVRVGPCMLRAGGAGPITLNYPFGVDLSKPGKCEADFTLEAPGWHASRFTFFASGAMEALEINGKPLPENRIAFRGLEQRVDFKGDLKPGANQLHVQFVSEGKRFTLLICPSVLDPLIEIDIALYFVAIGLSAWCLLILFPRHLHAGEACVLAAATCLRLLYLFATPYFIRAHDLLGHVFYIRYLLAHWTLPPVHLDWETFQAPLYYYFSALLSAPALVGGAPDHFLYTICQSAAFAISIANLFLCWWAARMLFHQAGDAQRRLWFLCLLSVIPSFIFTSAQINNDVLFSFFSFLWMALLLSFWKHPSFKKWLFVCLALSLGMLTKTSAACFVFISLVVMFRQAQLGFKLKCHYAATAGVIILLLCGWFEWRSLRHNNDAATFVIGNIHSVTHDLDIQPSFLKCVSFNPLEIMKNPFTTQFLQGSRRDVYWEYYLKSALFGEWKYHRSLLFIYETIALFAMALLPVAALGFFKSTQLTRPLAWPLVVTLPVVLITQLLFVCLAAPNAPQQDIRFFIIAILPACYFMVEGAHALRDTAGDICRWIMAVWIASCGMFVASMAVFPWMG